MHTLPLSPEEARATAEHLRERLRSSDAPAAPGAPTGAPSAVLVPLFLLGGELHVWLLRKAEGLRRHGGQVALPGGKPEPADGSLLETALREAHEEVGLERASVEILGELPPYPTFTGFVVTPFVGLVHGPFLPRPDPGEVARIFSAPLATFDVDGEPRPVSVLSWRRLVPAYLVEGEIVWGATAAILRKLAPRLR